tara:strand:+ start:106 stop:564 length:459 start_codon:yes stop_codon:yes gene_type:complete
MLQLKIKQALFKQCETFVNKRLQTVEETILSNQKGLQSETKSSAGDKHETGRAMMQLEMEKASQQLAGIYEMKEILSKINITKHSNIAHLGSLITTDVATYFLAISAGQITLAGSVYFAVSVSSPIGKLLLGKTVGDEVIFNFKKATIKRIK